MSENPLQTICQTFERISNAIQSHFLSFTHQSHHRQYQTPTSKGPLFSMAASSSNKPQPTTSEISSVQTKDIIFKAKSASRVTKEELGRATWTFLHTLAAQYPDRPTRQQKKDVKELMAILSRMYPCRECADHFKEVLRANPVQTGSHTEFSQWLCHVHNVVNRSLGKPVFSCERVDARWGKLECELRACDLVGSSSIGEETPTSIQINTANVDINGQSLM